MSSAIEWSLGLPCADQRDAIVASIVDPADTPSSAAAAEHLRRCPTCRAFRESLQTQQILVRKVAEQQLEEKKKRERQRKLRSEMTEWVDQELRVRGERELARLLWRLGTALLRIDPSVARQVFTETRIGSVDESSIPTILADTIAGLDAGDEFTPGSRDEIAQVRRSLATLHGEISASTYTDHEVRTELIRELAFLAESISRATNAPVQLLRANLEWYLGDESLVPGLLRKAHDSAIDPVQRAHAFANLALWSSSQGSFDDALVLVREAEQCFSLFASTRVNVAVWTAMLGDRRRAEREFAKAASIVGARQFRNYWPWSLVFGWLKKCAVLINASPRDYTCAVDSTWISYHR